MLTLLLDRHKWSTAELLRCIINVIHLIEMNYITLYKLMNFHCDIILRAFHC